MLTKIYDMNSRGGRVYNAVFTNQIIIFEYVGNRWYIYLMLWFGLPFIVFLFGGIICFPGIIVTWIIAGCYFVYRSRQMKETNLNVILNADQKSFYVLYDNIKEFQPYRGHKIDILLDTNIKYQFKLDRKEYKKLMEVLEILC